MQLLNRVRSVGGIVLLALVAGGYCGPSPGASIAAQYRSAPRATNPLPPRWQNGEQVTVHGTVSRLLADDRNGSRHQRFIIRTDSGNTLLIAHNIDLAPRLDGLVVGDGVVASGEYQSNPQGGLLHWTHRDPAGHHRTGYIQWKGRRYE